MIPGISDRRRLPRLGKIRLGIKKQGGKGEYPAASDHFIFKDAPAVEKVYGNKCTELDIVFPCEKRDIFFEQALKAYRASGLFCRCDDGETAHRVCVDKDAQGKAYIKSAGLDVSDGEMFDIPCPYQECDYFTNRYCRPIGRLLFMIPRVPGFGCYEISTTSWNGMVQVGSYIEDIRDAAGRVSHIPLKLRLVPMNVSPDGKKKTVYVLNLVYEGTIKTLTDMRRKALPAPVKASAMPAEKAGEVPDDLMPDGGGKLDEKLEDEESEKDNAGAARDLLGGSIGKRAAPQEAESPPPHRPTKKAKTSKKAPW